MLSVNTLYIDMDWNSDYTFLYSPAEQNIFVHFQQHVLITDLILEGYNLISKAS